jgi:hypothetical protein
MARRANPRLQRAPSAPLSRQPLGRGSHWLAVVVVGASCYIGCARDRQLAVSNLPPELKTPAGATRVSARGEGRAVGVEYWVSVPYPADSFLADITNRMKQGSWTPAETDLLNPSIPSSHVRGWTSYIDGRGSPRLGVHQWMADWRNRDGDVVSYALEYSSVLQDRASKPPPPSNSDLHVTAFMIPAQEANAMAAQAKRMGAK